LVSSLNKWTKEIATIPDWSVDKNAVGEYKILVPSMEDSFNVNAVFQPNLIYTPRKGTVIISHRVTGLPTSSSKGTIMDYEFASISLYPEPWRENDVILYTPIYGQICFSGRAKGLTVEFNNNQKPVPMWSKKTYVYQFGNCNEWRGILSTLSELSMIGYGAVNTAQIGKPEKWDISAKVLGPFDLREFPTSDLWYKAVGDACCTATFTFMAPVSRFSPISNLPYISKQGVQILLSQVEAEDGTLIGNVVRMPSKKKQLIQVQLHYLWTMIIMTLWAKVTQVLLNIIIIVIVVVAILKVTTTVIVRT